MKKIIYRYINTSGYRIVNDKIVNGDDVIIDSNKLIKELILVFCLSKKELKWYLKSWVKSKSKNFNFNKWWVKLPDYINFTYDNFSANGVHSIINGNNNIVTTANINYVINVDNGHNTTTTDSNIIYTRANIDYPIGNINGVHSIIGNNTITTNTKMSYTTANINNTITNNSKMSYTSANINNGLL